MIEADGSAYPCDFYVTDEWRPVQGEPHQKVMVVEKPGPVLIDGKAVGLQRVVDNRTAAPVYPLSGRAQRGAPGILPDPGGLWRVSDPAVPALVCGSLVVLHLEAIHQLRGGKHPVKGALPGGIQTVFVVDLLVPVH